MANISPIVGEHELLWIFMNYQFLNVFFNGRSRNFVSTLRRLVLRSLRRHFRTSAWGCTKVGILFSLITTTSSILHRPIQSLISLWNLACLRARTSPRTVSWLSAVPARMLPRLFPTYTHAAPATVGEVAGPSACRISDETFRPSFLCFSNALLIKVNKTLLSTDLCLGAFFRSLWTAKPGARVFSCLDAAVFPLDLRIPQALEQWLPNPCWLIILWSYTIHYYPI